VGQRRVAAFAARDLLIMVNSSMPDQVDMAAGSPQPSEPADPLLTVDDVCGWFRVTKDWVYDEVEARRLPFVRLGRKHLRFRTKDLQVYLAARVEGRVTEADQAR
jgi:excisionase family DNA binding protein